MPDVLLLPEAADWLRLSERTLYDLARARRLPAAQLGGKWLFPRAALGAWLAARAMDGVEKVPAPPPILAGSHDPLLDWALRHSACGLALRAGGSLDGLEALERGEALLAASHLPDPDGDGFNEASARERLPGRALAGITWAWRDQGLIVPRGNPAGLSGVADLARPGLRVAGRQGRAGSHVLLLHLLAGEGIRLDRLAFLPTPCRSEEEVAGAVAEGRADAGFGILAAARAAGTGFAPVMRERMDLVMTQRAFFAPPVQALLDFARGEAFRAEAARLGGYDVARTGQVAFAG